MKSQRVILGLTALASGVLASPKFMDAAGLAAAGTRACQRLAAKYPEDIFWPQSDTFQTESTAIYSNTCILSPSCVFEPSSAEDIGSAVKIIKAARSRFAVRAGGHMPVPGAQSVESGVMIALNKLNTKRLNKDKAIASIGPGQVWADVYTWLAPKGLAVNGGRYGTVGVGGLLVGGGISYFSSTRGWGCDTIVAYEVVLADGCVVEAKAHGKYADLFWALHGGHNNFGIVTRFDMKTFPVTSAFIGGGLWDGSNTSTQTQFFSAFESYMAPGGGVDDPNVAISAIIGLTPSTGAKQLTSIQFAPGKDSSPRAFENFTAIDAPFIQAIGGTVMPSWTALPILLAQLGVRGSREVYSSVSFFPDPRAIRIANETVTELAVPVLSQIPDSEIAFTYQPVSKDWLEASKASGHNMLDLDPRLGTFIAGLITITWTDAAHDAAVNKLTQRIVRTIENRTRALGLYYPFIYLNDAGPTQRPFDTYGGGGSLPKLRAIRAKYDPERFLENFLGHGFPLQ
ncbi:hypothetical protein F5B22DRAFT_427395 [Xylaria bambusicola]|uniref:uncharacterized protein n=1 Tax=Xylaria bambusicola TaxID=326684 RepID=UPI0020080962|nr:uncharacterized protein F5B22DRAFT_427395 [Xylaria bambusicola]KAI0506893.1 hypothetical protein F5B22DRAFT_427395 [Xylaria bambusicola]